MSDLQPVRCRTCGSVNFVALDRDFVQVGVPASLYDEVIKVLHRGTRKKPTRARPQTAPPEEMERAIAMRVEGKTYREIAADMGWTLSSTYRRLEGTT